MTNIEKELNLTPYERDCMYAIQINNKLATRGWWNLVVSIRDLNLWIKGIRPHRHWRLKHVKHYFNVKGSAEKILQQLEDLKAEYDTGKTNLTNLTD